ncbi:Vacuolar protein sorting-associated protein 26A, partial [Perkinsus olseni]
MELRFCGDLSLSGCPEKSKLGEKIRYFVALYPGGKRVADTRKIMIQNQHLPRFPPFLPACGPEGQPLVRKAIIVGQAHYEANGQSIHHALADSQIVAHRLSRIGYDVTVGINLETEELRRYLMDGLDELEPGSLRLVIYFIGMVERRTDAAGRRESLLCGVDRRFSPARMPEDLALEELLKTLEGKMIIGSTALMVVDATRSFSTIPGGLERGSSSCDVVTPPMVTHSEGFLDAEQVALATVLGRIPSSSMGLSSCVGMNQFSPDRSFASDFYSGASVRSDLDYVASCGPYPAEVGRGISLLCAHLPNELLPAEFFEPLSMILSDESTASLLAPEKAQIDRMVELSGVATSVKSRESLRKRSAKILKLPEDSPPASIFGVCLDAALEKFADDYERVCTGVSADVSEATGRVQRPWSRDGEDVCGTATVRLKGDKRLEHQGIRVELIGQVGKK